MPVRDDGFYLADRVRRLCEERPFGVDPWKGRAVHGLLDRALRSSDDQQGFYLAFLDGVRDLLDDEDEDAVLMRFARQAAQSESRVLADSSNRDHLAHVTQVFLLGWWILNACSKFRTLAEWRPYGWDPETRFSLLNRAWVHTSLLHDCAYSVQVGKEARDHEVRVRAMFGPMVEPAPARRLNLNAARDRNAALWDQRARTIGRRIGAAVKPVIARIESYPDHGFVTGQALMAEAATHPSGTKQLLEIAASSLFCHNFRHCIDPRDSPDPEVVDWFGVDFWTEPLAALLTVTDEIQEWGRERVDASRIRRGIDDFVPEGVVLTGIDVDDAYGLSIDATLLFRLFPEDREHRQRRATTRAINNAQSSRQYRNAFRAAGAGREFDLHLRITETVEDVPCRVGRHRGWLPDAQRDLERRSLEALDAARPPTSISRVEATVGEDPVTFSFELEPTGEVTTRGERRERGLRVLVVAAGGAGKSTMLRALARTPKLWGQTPAAIYVDELDDDLTDLSEACNALREASPSRDVLLVVDHLDRIVGTPNEAYWLDQLEGLPAVDWLHVVGAVRPEEHVRVIGFQLSFEVALLRQRVGPLMADSDPGGRTMARAIETLLPRPGAAHLGTAGSVALAMRDRRFLHRPAPPWSNEVTFGDGTLLIAQGGKLRFAHDAVQDYFSALALARALASGSHTAIRALFELPRDVFRLLLDILVSSKQLSRGELRRAREGFAKGLLAEATLWHWLTDMGRLVQAGFAVAAFREAVEGDAPEVAMVGEALYGILRFTEHTPVPSRRDRGALKADVPS